MMTDSARRTIYQGAIIGVLILVCAVVLMGCATTMTTQRMETTLEDGTPEVTSQKTVVLAFGNSSIEAAQPDTLNERDTDGESQISTMASGSTVKGIQSTEGVMSALVQIVERYLDAKASETTVLQDLSEALSVLRAAPLIPSGPIGALPPSCPALYEGPLYQTAPIGIVARR